MQQLVRYAITGTLRNAIVVLLAACLAVVDGGATSAARADPLSATEVYSQAMSAMGELPQPAYVTYRLESDSDGLQVDLFTPASLPSDTFAPDAAPFRKMKSG